MTLSWQEANPIADTAAEAQVIASALIDPGCVPDVLRIVDGPDFLDAAHRAAFVSIAERQRTGDPIHAPEVARDLRDCDAVDNPHAYLAGVADIAVTAAHWRLYAGRVRDAAINRRVAEASEDAFREASEGRPPDEVLANLSATLESVRDRVERKAAFPKLRFDELDERYQTLADPVVDGLFRRGEVANLIGAPKCGKSWMAYGLSLAVVNNERWLGRFEVSGGRVLYIDNEIPRPVLRSRLRHVAEAMGIERDSIGGDLEVWSLRDNPKTLSELGPDLDAIAPGDFDLIVFDAWYRFQEPGFSENDNAAVTQAYNALNRLAAKTEAAIVLVHHTSKGGQSGKEVTDVGSGAGAQSRCPDCHAVVREHEEDGCMVLDAKVRSFKPVDPVVLRMAWPVWIPAEGLDPGALKGRHGKGQQAKAEQDNADKDRIEQAIIDEDKPATRKALRKRVGMGDCKLRRLLDSLESDGRIVSTPTTIRGNETEVYSPAPDDVDDVDRTTSDHETRGETEGVDRPLKGGRTTYPRSAKVGPGGEATPTPDHVTDGPMPFPEFEAHAG